MIRMNCVRFNVTAADAQRRELGIRSLLAWYTGLGVEMSLSVLTYFWQLFTNRIMQCEYISARFYSVGKICLFHFGVA